MVTRAELRRADGRVFDAIADEYDRNRPTYPDALVDRACEVAALAPGATVLEIGCGTGQLTRSLLSRGLRVTAVEPGRQLIARARDELHGAAGVRFINATVEDVSIPPGHYRAAFSASAIHWVDPDVGWRKLADALADGGTLALVSYFGLRDERSDDDQRALRAALARIAPELAAEWPVYRDLVATVAGAERRRGNVSEVWAWLGGYDLAREHARELFDDVGIDVVPMHLEHTADELNALLATMSFWSRLSPAQRDALAAENRAVHERLGRPLRSSTVACVVTARRVPRG